MRRFAFLFSILVLSGCKGEAFNETKMIPRTAPPLPSVPKDLSILVEIDGKPGSPIDAKILENRRPDFEDHEHKAWRIISLLDLGAGRAIQSIAVVSAKAISVSMPPPKDSGDLQPVLTLTRRGQISAALVSPADPFPAFHGRGRRLSRGADPIPRVATPVSRVVVTTATVAG